LRTRAKEIEMNEDRNGVGERRVEREAVLPASPEEVWEALTDEERLAEWLADDVELDPVEGGDLRVRDADDDDARTGTVETVIERERLAFTWAAPGEDPSRVEFTVEAIPAGTRLVVTETAISAPRAIATGTCAMRWDARLMLLGFAVLLSAEPALS
jgi:uncharacterized protein YndB with AHSA1/START domain